MAKKYKIRQKENPTLSLAEFEGLAGRFVDEIPGRLVRDLNGGFLLLPEAKKDGEFFIMGEYVEEPVLGCTIILYYGSFSGLLGGEPREDWEAEMRDTIVHELRHHLESLAGVDDLVREETAELDAWRRV